MSKFLSCVCHQDWYCVCMGSENGISVYAFWTLYRYLKLVSAFDPTHTLCHHAAVCLYECGIIFPT